LVLFASFNVWCCIIEIKFSSGHSTIRWIVFHSGHSLLLPVIYKCAWFKQNEHMQALLGYIYSQFGVFTQTSLFGNSRLSFNFYWLSCSFGGFYLSIWQWEVGRFKQTNKKPKKFGGVAHACNPSTGVR
jgi:hypothetical protein